MTGSSDPRGAESAAGANASVTANVSMDSDVNSARRHKRAMSDDGGRGLDAAPPHNLPDGLAYDGNTGGTAVTRIRPLWHCRGGRLGTWALALEFPVIPPFREEPRPAERVGVSRMAGTPTGPDPLATLLGKGRLVTNPNAETTIPAETAGLATPAGLSSKARNT